MVRPFFRIKARLSVSLVLLLWIFFPGVLFARSHKDAEVVVMGQGKTKDDAMNDAFRKAISQTYGVFIYSSTRLDNDELTEASDISVSSGNIASYQELGSLQRLDGVWEISLSVKVGIAQFDQSCIATNQGDQSVKVVISPLKEQYLLNERIEQLRMQNQQEVLTDMLEVVSSIMNPSLFQTSIESTKPVINHEGNRIKYELKGTIGISPQFVALDHFILSTLCALSEINRNAIKERDKGEYNELRLAAPTYRALENKRKIIIEPEIYNSILASIKQELDKILSSYSFYRNGVPIGQGERSESLFSLNTYTLFNKAEYVYTVIEDIYGAEDVVYTFKSCLL